jgi:hypothetical protein
VSLSDLNEIYEQQQAFRETEQTAVDEATQLPVEEAREQLAELAQRQQEWIDEQKRMLRDRLRQHAQARRAADGLRQIGRDLTRGRGWSL